MAEKKLMKQPDTNLAKAIRELQNEVDQKNTLLEALRKEYDPEDIDFYQYIKTQAWEETRQKVFRRDGFKCVICNEAKNLNVHHITYENLGAEKVSDLVTLCQGCHENIHNGQPVRGFNYEIRDAIERKILLLWGMTSAKSPERERLTSMLKELKELEES